MIDKETLQKIAKLQNLRLWQQEKHYIQSIILVALSEHPLAFKGGTYLWFFHGLNRFSEDLDFTCTAEELPKDLGMQISESLRLLGVDNALKMQKGIPGAYSFRISAQGPLYTRKANLCHVYVEISKREKLAMPPVAFSFAQSQYSLPSKMVAGLALPEVAAEKVRALLMRSKARDLYDLCFLAEQKQVKFDMGLVDAKLKSYGLAFSKEELEKKIDEKEERWESELEPLVFGNLMKFEDAKKAVLKWAK
jgi:predicted nucleotidyltransferase component of viral defense system